MTINNNNIFGAFTLGEVRSGQLTGNWLNKEAGANYGWFGGGFAPGPAVVSTVDRIDFVNDTLTASAKSPLSSTRYRLAATGNSNYGWFGGGSIPGSPTSTAYSTVDRIDFSNDSATISTRGPLSLARYALGASGNSNYGWFGGGFPGYSTVDRVDFNNDSATAAKGSLSSIRSLITATGNSNYGWFGGGYSTIPGPLVSSIDRIDFSNDSATSSTRGRLSLARWGLAATGNSNYGWFGGGYIPGTPLGAANSTVDRIDFSNDLVAAIARNSLSSSKFAISATGNSNYGWFGGGNPGPLSTVDRIDFSNDSATISTRGPLSLARYYLSATSGVLNKRRQKSGSYGWFGGAFVPSLPGRVSTVDRIDFSNDSPTPLTRGQLSSARSSSTATGNSNYGWFGGGFPGSVGTSIVDRINFSNDSGTASVRGPLNQIRYSSAATGNSNYGWFGGGSILPTPAVASIERSSIDRIDFSNDLINANDRSPFLLAKGSLAATGNSNYGWWGGGNTPTSSAISTIDRIDFSNDFTTPLPRGGLSPSLDKYDLAATGNSNYGWFGGGRGAGTNYSIVDRIDFSNDFTTPLPRNPLTQARTLLAATGNSNYGWFAGGIAPGVPSVTYSRVDRITFSNDTATASPRGPLSSTRWGLAATSNTNK